MNDQIILAKILSWINCGSDYKAVTLTSSMFRDVAQAVHPTADTKFANQLLTLMKLYPDRNWDHLWLSSNPNITWDIVKYGPYDRRWNYCGLSGNPAIT